MQAGARPVYAHRSGAFQGVEAFFLSPGVFSLSNIRLLWFCGPNPLKRGIVRHLKQMTIGTYNRVGPKPS